MISDGKIPAAPGTNQIVIKMYIAWTEVHSIVIFPSFTSFVLNSR